MRDVQLAPRVRNGGRDPLVARQKRKILKLVISFSSQRGFETDLGVYLRKRGEAEENL